MTDILSTYLRNQGVRLIENSLKGVIGKAPVFVNDDTHYQQYVIQHAFTLLPLPIRRLGGENLRLDELFYAMRLEVFDLTSGRIELLPNPTERILAVIKSFYGIRDESDAADRPAHAPQTEEPGPLPPADVVGIDLGTTYSVIAHLDPQGRPTSIPNVVGDVLTPSVVLFDDDKTIVGKEALLASKMEPDKVAECVKRDMGAKVYRKKINGEYMPPEVISSFILRSLKADAERKLGPIDQAVVTVPAYFDDTRRRATVDAGRLAGLQVLDIINEPTAAAIAYGYHLGFLDSTCKFSTDKPLRVLVYDLGGGTFDVTIVEISGNDFKALATDGDVYLGGKDWDEKLIGLAAERFRDQYRDDPRTNPVSLQELSISAETAKRTLSERQKATIYVNHIGTRMKVEIARQEFEEATLDLVGRTRTTTEIVIRQAGLSWADIDQVLLVGGCTRMPMILNMLKELTGKTPERSISADEAVAHGAALYANMLAAKQQETGGDSSFSVTNINSHSLGVLGADPETGRKLNKILIPKNTPLPASKTKTFKTLKPNQRSVVIAVLEGESEKPEVCAHVGTCKITDLPPNLPAGWPVQVSYSYKANGRLHVEARLKGHDASVTTDFMRENSMPDDDVEMWAKFVEDELVTD